MAKDKVTIEQDGTIMTLECTDPMTAMPLDNLIDMAERIIRASGYHFDGHLDVVVEE